MFHFLSKKGSKSLLWAPLYTSQVSPLNVQTLNWSFMRWHLPFFKKNYKSIPIWWHLPFFRQLTHPVNQTNLALSIFYASITISPFRLWNTDIKISDECELFIWSKKKTGWRRKLGFKCVYAQIYLNSLMLCAKTYWHAAQVQHTF